MKSGFKTRIRQQPLLPKQRELVLDAAYLKRREERRAERAVNHPRHYNAHPSGVECIAIVECMSFNVGNAMKYLWRADEKGAPIEDLKKARWCIDREIQRREKKR